MRKVLNVAIRLTLLFTTLVTTGSPAASGKQPVLLELFTSEGCSSCPPADQLLATLDEKQPEPEAEVIVLSEHVDYFNYLGWKDPFSAKIFTERQESFAARPGFDGVYTPQLVIDGRFGVLGSDHSAALAAIRKALQEPKVQVAIVSSAQTGAQVAVRVESTGSPNKKVVSGALFVALAEERIESQVLRGENAGRVLRHVAVVRALKSAGQVSLQGFSTREVTMPLESGWGRNGLRVVVFIQDPASGHILGVGAQKVKL